MTVLAIAYNVPAVADAPSEREACSPERPKGAKAATVLLSEGQATSPFDSTDPHDRHIKRVQDRVYDSIPANLP